MKTGRAIRMVREAKGLRMSAVAAQAKISVSMLSLIESGDREPSLPALSRIAEALDVPIDSFLVLSQSTLKTSNSRAQRLAESIDRLASAEKALQRFLERER